MQIFAVMKGWPKPPNLQSIWAEDFLMPDTEEETIKYCRIYLKYLAVVQSSEKSSSLALTCVPVTTELSVPCAAEG